MPVHELLERVTSVELTELQALMRLRAEDQAEHDQEMRDRQERERKLREAEQHHTLGGGA